MLLQTTFVLSLLATVAMQRIIVFFVAAFVYIHIIGSTVPKKYDASDGTSKPGILSFSKDLNKIKFRDKQASKIDSKSKILLMNDFDDDNGTKFTDGNENYENIDKRNAVEDKRGRTKSSAEGLKLDKKNTDEVDNGGIDDDGRYANHFYRSLFQFRPNTEQVSKHYESDKNYYYVENDGKGDGRR